MNGPMSRSRGTMIVSMASAAVYVAKRRVGQGQGAHGVSPARGEVGSGYRPLGRQRRTSRYAVERLRPRRLAAGAEADFLHPRLGFRQKLRAARLQRLAALVDRDRIRRAARRRAPAAARFPQARRAPSRRSCRPPEWAWRRPSGPPRVGCSHPADSTARRRWGTRLSLMRPSAWRHAPPPIPPAPPGRSRLPAR